MGQIGRSYPRFEEASASAAEAAEPRAGSAFQTLGAIVGVVCALAFIGWLLLR